ncbi:maleylacetoacetate isomerase [Primorskyibacter aestuariivivens]|uniref:maleylacetoacetate isomerase n=1 Tax=Primorskyibacter aestuariivivens TaxID=1888912 RepID=UPI0023009079|nr:maleylacetoacetate isomerase [Primorskyibacter aestuariivivens]MDA7430355.1 maleylacetoacetate isomerase [Primorskyibacter aestuariivivens]
MTVLYDYWRSSASYRVRIALNLAGEEWRAVPVDLLAAEHKATAHLARHPQGLVPALEIDGIMMTQSLAIIEYLEETRGLGLLPDAPGDRARVRAMAYAIAIDIHPVCNLSVARFAVEQSGGALNMQDWMQHFITPGLRAFEAMLGPGRYCWGNGVSLADLCLVPQLYNARRWAVDLTDMPRIRAIDARLNDLPAFAAAHPDRVKPA